MKKVLLLTGAMLMLTIGVASAQGINLSWDDCYLSGAGLMNKDNACTSNFGAPNKLVLALNPDGQIDNINGAQGIIDIQTVADPLPDWWHMEPNTGCRAGALSGDVAIGSANAPYSCPEPWASAGGGQAGGAQLAPGIGGSNRARITWIVGLPGTTVFDSNIAPDWYVMAINILNTKTTTCAGCVSPACLVANEMRLTRPAEDPRGDVFIYVPDVSQSVTWQGGNGDCPGSTPTKTSTWGQVKSLYR